MKCKKCGGTGIVPLREVTGNPASIGYTDCPDCKKQQP